MKNLVFFFLTICFLSTTQTSFAATKTKKGEISMASAKEIALKTVNGKIKSSEYEFEKGQNVYSFDITSDDGVIHEILISAKTGKIVSNKIETAEEEAAEEKADQNKK